MSEIVSVLGVTHNPMIPVRLDREPQHWGDFTEGVAQYRRILDESNADLVVVIGSDHLNQWFMDNMSPFLVGKSDRAEGPFAHEREMFGLGPYRAGTDSGFARELIASGHDAGVDLAFSDEYVLDHSFTVPMGYLRPEADLPIIPLFTNVMAPPFPSAKRFFAVGESLRQAVFGIPGSRRVAVVGSGHLSLEIGGPRMPNFGVRDDRPDPDFDEEVLRMMAEGAVEELTDFASPRRMSEAGNLTSGFLNFVLLAGLAGGVAPVEAVARNHCPFVAWR